jgi:hypothetical protein
MVDWGLLRRREIRKDKFRLEKENGKPRRTPPKKKRSLRISNNYAQLS